MSAFLFAILDAAHARGHLIIPQRALAKAQDRYDRALATAEARSNSKNPEVRQRANAALTVALDALDECRATLDAAQERSAGLDKAEQELAQAQKEAYLAQQESRELTQHRNCHA